MGEPGAGGRGSDKRESFVCTYWLAATPPNCVAFVAVVAFVAFVALVAFVAFVALVAFVAEATVLETLLPDTELICASCTQLEQALDSTSAADALALRTA